MIYIIGVLIFFVIILLPGFVTLRLLRVAKFHPINALLYAVGFGLVFNVIAGLVANFTFGINLISLIGVYIGLLIALVVVNFKFGRSLLFDCDWKSAAFITPVVIYLLAVGLQFQTTLISPNLVGSDVHLEYYVANLTLQNGFWNPMYTGSTINACLGITILTPVWSLLTGLELMDVFRIICPLVFAFLPLALYRIYKMQFGTLIAVLSVLFVITTPMFTMDLIQLIRQQQSMLYFVLVVLLLLDDSLTVTRKVVLGAIFGVGAITGHYGFSVGYVGYTLIGSVVIIVLAIAWRNKQKILDTQKPILPRLALMGIAIISLITYIGYYSWVNNGKLLEIGTLPTVILEGTVKQAIAGVTKEHVVIPATEDYNLDMRLRVDWSTLEEPVDWAVVNNPLVDKPIVDVPVTPVTPVAPAYRSPTIMERFPFIDPLQKEPIVRTAIGLDFAKASTFGKVWRVLQYLVELCLIIGFFVFMFKPYRKVRLEYVALVVTSFFVLAGVFLLSMHSYGMGASRVWLVALLFMSPLFVIGASKVGEWISKIARIRIFHNRKLILWGTLVLFVPYSVFNLGVVFELAKSQTLGYVDMPFSVALSGHRVDVATIFDKEDVEAVDWFKEYLINSDNPNAWMYSDEHGGKLLTQRIGFDAGQHSVLKWMDENATGYIFLRKWNVDSHMVTNAGEYGTRQSFSIDEYPIFKEKVEKGTVIFDNGARIIKINEGG